MSKSIFSMLSQTNNDTPIDQNNSTDVKIKIQDKMMKNDINDLNMFVSFRGALFKGSILSSFCATVGLSTLTFFNIAPNITPTFAISNRAKLFPIGMFIVAGSLNLLFNQLDSKLEVQQKRLLNKYNINTETYVDQNTLNDIPTPTIPSFSQTNSTQTNSTQTNSTQPNSTQTNSTQPNSTQTNST